MTQQDERDAHHMRLLREHSAHREQVRSLEVQVKAFVPVLAALVQAREHELPQVTPYGGDQHKFCIPNRDIGIRTERVVSPGSGRLMMISLEPEKLTDCLEGLVEAKDKLRQAREQIASEGLEDFVELKDRRDAPRGG